MNKILLVFFGRDQLQLSLLESTGSRNSKTIITDLADNTALLDDVTETIGILSATDVSTFVREVPPQQKKYLSKTLPYLLEDDLIQAVETQHIVSQLLSNTIVRAVVISRTLLKQYLDRARTQNITLTKLIIDADLLGIDPDAQQNRLMSCNGHQLIKTKQGILSTIPSAMPIDSIVEGLDAQVASSFDNYKQFVAEAIHSPQTNQLAPINLLKGDFAPASSLKARSNLVQRVVTTCAILLAIQSLYWAMIGAEYQHKADSLALQSTQIYRDYFPQDQSIIDIRRQAEGHINQVKSADVPLGLLGILQQLGQAIQMSPDKDSVLVKSIRYQHQSPDIKIELSGPNLAIIENIRTSLGKSLIAKTEQVNQSSEPNGGITARLTVSSSDAETGRRNE